MPLVRIAVLMLLMAVGSAVAIGVWGVRQLDGPGPLAAPTSVVVPKGSSLLAIGRILQQAGAVSHAYWVVAGAKLRGVGRQLQAGEYALPAGVSVNLAIDLLRDGQTVARRITIPEGLTSAQVVAIVEATDGLTGSIAELPSEGSLLPDTYLFSHGDARDAVIRRMQNAMAKTLSTLWAERVSDLPIDSPTEALILASIVEKETAVPEERARVAGVFFNRLNRGMRLQSDPTVVYALTEGRGPLDRPLTRADWKLDSPFNTYIIAALPPKPIANPGRDSLMAVMAPEQHDFFYFVADGAGGHAFSRTLAEHNRNVAALRRLRRAAHQNADNGG